MDLTSFASVFQNFIKAVFDGFLNVSSWLTTSYTFDITKFKNFFSGFGLDTSFLPDQLEISIFTICGSLIVTIVIIWLIHFIKEALS